MHSYLSDPPSDYPRELHGDPVLHGMKLRGGFALRQRNLVAFLQQKRIHEQIGGGGTRLGRPEQLLDELLEIGIGDLGEGGRRLVLRMICACERDGKDLGEELVGGLAFRVGCFLCEDFEETHAEGVHVCFLVVHVGVDDFGRHVRNGACDWTVFGAMGGKTQVSDTN